MDFRFRHLIARPVQVVERTLLDPETLLAMPGRVGVIAAVEAVEHTEVGTHVRRVARFTPDLEALSLPRIARPEWAAWEEQITWSLPDDRGEFRIVPALPDHYLRRFSCEGTYALHPHSEGTERIVEGQLRIRVPLIGAAAERTAIRILARAFDDEAALLAERA